MNRADWLFQVLVRAISCRHKAVDGDICCRCGFRVDYVPTKENSAIGRYILSEDQSTNGALGFLEPGLMPTGKESTDG
jgi:hypothetical protein